MANFEAKAIANEFLSRNGGPLEQMKLQKLVYIAHGWNLAINREPLVADRIEAWDGGPVMRRIWNHLRDFGYNVNSHFIGNGPDGGMVTAPLSEPEKSIIDHVWRKYGSYTGLELSEMTHKEGTPWSNSYFGNGRNSQLSQTDIQQHFIELALAGRTQTA